MRHGARILALWLLCAASAHAERTTRVATLELSGPLDGVELTLPDGARARVEGRLQVGETRTLRLPFTTATARDVAPRIELAAPLDPSAPTPRARFAGWSELVDALAALAPGLRARSYPALGEPVTPVPAAAPFVLLVAAVLVVYLRSRVLLALCVSALSAGALIVLVGASASDATRRATLIDGAAGSTPWRRIEAAWDELSVSEEHGPFDLVSDPAGAPVTWSASLEPGASWRASAPGARLFVLRVQDTLVGGFTPERNRVVDLDPVWARRDGAWQRLAPWKAGAPLPAAIGPGTPPAWLATGLPQGVTLLVARDAGVPDTWLRIAGLP